MPLTALTRAVGTIYLMGAAILLILFLYAILRGRSDAGLGITLGLIFGWPLVLLNDRLRARLWDAVKPN